MTNKTNNHRGYGPYNCYLCRRELNRAGILFNDRLATIRVFTGVPGGAGLAGGYAACDRHAAAAIEQAMRPLLQPTFSKNYPNHWAVVAYRVELDEHGDPRLGHRLFIAQHRLFGAERAPA